MAMTTPDENERVEIGDNSRQATVRHLWGMVYGVSRPGEEEFRITAKEVEDLADYIGDRPLEQQAAGASFTVRQCDGCDDKKLTLPTADGRPLCSECMKDVPRKKRPRVAQNLGESEEDQTEVMIEHGGGRLLFRDVPAGVMIEADPGNGMWKEIGIVTADESDQVSDVFRKR